MSFKNILKTVLIFAVLSGLFIRGTARADEISGETGAEAPLTAGDTGGGALLSERGFKLIYENSHGELYTDVSGDFKGTFALRRKNDGEVWFSNSPALLGDSIAFNTDELMSFLVVSYYNGSRSLLETANSKVSSVDRSSFEIFAVKNGLRFEFTFNGELESADPEDDTRTVVTSAAAFKIPVFVLLNDDGSLSVKIDAEKIEEYEDFRIFDITLLPWFCAADSDDEGFLLIPDGSGAVINLNNGKTSGGSVSLPIYGGDAGVAQDLRLQIAEKALMPVFGISRNSAGMLAVIEQGAERATLTAEVAGISSDWNRLYNVFALRQISSYTFDQGWQGRKTFNVFQETAPEISALENKYFFLGENDNGLAGMAETYRDYLGLKDKTEAPAEVFLELVGAVRRKKSVLGFPAKPAMKLTSFSEALEILRELAGEGVDKLNLRYLSWDSKTLDGKLVNKAKPASVLGGRSGFNKLSEYAEKNGIGFFPDADLLCYSKNSFPFANYFTAARNMNNEITKLYSYKRNHNTQDKAKGFSYLQSVLKLEKSAASFLKSFGKLDAGGISLSSLGNTALNDYKSKNSPLESWETAEIFREIILGAAAGGPLMLDSPFITYAAESDYITNLPGGSEYDMTDYTVPFYQMVTTGAVTCAGRAINLEADARKAFLTAVETGGGLHYTLLANSESELIKGTKYDYLIGAGAKHWIALIAESFKELEEIRKQTGGRLVDFQLLSPGLSKSTFETGAVLVNKNAEPAAWGDAEIPAKGYLILKGEE